MFNVQEGMCAFMEPAWSLENLFAARYMYRGLIRILRYLSTRGRDRIFCQLGGDGCAFIGPPIWNWASVYM